MISCLLFFHLFRLCFCSLCFFDCCFWVIVLFVFRVLLFPEQRKPKTLCWIYNETKKAFVFQLCLVNNTKRQWRHSSNSFKREGGRGKRERPGTFVFSLVFSLFFLKTKLDPNARTFPPHTEAATFKLHCARPVVSQDWKKKRKTNQQSERKMTKTKTKSKDKEKHENSSVKLKLEKNIMSINTKHWFNVILFVWLVSRRNAHVWTLFFRNIC